MLNHNVGCGVEEGSSSTPVAPAARRIRRVAREDDEAIALQESMLKEYSREHYRK